MKFNQIILKNLRRNLRHYALYLFSLILSIILYFSFVTLQYTDSVNTKDAGQVIQSGAKVGAIFLLSLIHI